MSKLSKIKFTQHNLNSAAAAKSLQSCLTLCDPTDSSLPGSPVPGILQARTHRSGLPFPSPMHESEKWKWSRSVCNSSRPHGLQPTRLLRPWDFPGRSTGVGCHRLLRLKSARAPHQQPTLVWFSKVKLFVIFLQLFCKFEIVAIVSLSHVHLFWPHGL